jgi:hypothetical protein
MKRFRKKRLKKSGDTRYEKLEITAGTKEIKLNIDQAQVSFLSVVYHSKGESDA